MKLQTVAFNWKKDVTIDGIKKYTCNTNEKRDFGLIAQEVEAVLPTVIHENKITVEGTDYKSIDYEKLVPHLIAAIQELEARIKVLET